jgi:hypothetical protein
METMTVNVCTDCIMWAANRDDSGNGLEWTREAFVKGMEGIAHLSPVEGEDGLMSTHFSWHYCDICSVPLGGDRVECVAVLAGE